MFIFREIEIDIPPQTRANGTLFLHLVLVNDHGPFEWRHLKREGLTIMQRVSLTDYIIPKAATFNLLGNNEVNFLFIK